MEPIPEPFFMILRHLSIMCEHGAVRAKEFNLSTHCVTNLYLGCLGDLHTKDVAKIVLRVTAAIAEKSEQLALGVLEVHRQFAFDTYWDMSNDEKKHAVFRVLDSTMPMLGSRHAWDLERIANAADRVRGLGLRNVQRWKRTAFNRSRRLRAGIVYEFDVDSLVGYAVAIGRDGVEVGRKELFNLPPTNFHLASALGTIRWSDQHTVELVSRLGDQRWHATL